MVVIDIIFSKKIVDFPEIEKKPNTPIGFALSKNWAGVFGKGRVVIIPYLCRSASSTVISSSRLIGVANFVCMQVSHHWV